MKIERLKKNHKKQIIIGAVVICIIGGALTFNLTKAKYKLTESIPLVRGTVNYKAYDFKVMAMYKSEDGTNYTEITDRMPNSGYKINESKSYCTSDNKNKDTAVRLYTENGKHIMENLAKSDKCYLYFDKKDPENIQEIIAAVNPKTTTPTFSNTATTDEGVYAVSDGMYGGTSYYWRGAVTNNYVKFAGFCWRIVRINGDETMRLIYDGSTCHANGTSTTGSIAVKNIKYNTSHNQSNYVGWTYEGASQRPTDNITSTASNAKTQLESWYSSNIGNNATYISKVADGKYCNDRDVESGSTWTLKGNSFYYAANNRINTGAPTLSCNSSDIYTLKVGLITVDEAMYAGGKVENNNKYYLYNGQYYWTMSPFYWWGSDNIRAHVFNVNYEGKINYSYVSTEPNLRPVINLRSDITFSSGNGTQSSPYIVQ